MEYKEFSKYKKVSDPKTLVNGYEDEEGNIFYVEPAFYYNLQGFKDKRAEAFEPILKEMERIVKANHHVIFTGNFEAPMYEKEGKAQLVVGLGCTGGQHRSLTFAILLADHFNAKGYSTQKWSRDKNRNVAEVLSR